MRVRFRFTKLGKVRFTSHRDVARLWERALRRAALPVASTEGFSPRPKVHFGLALSTGHESLGEYLDVDLRGPDGDSPPVDVDALPRLLTPLLPQGLDVETAAVIDRSWPSLQEAVTACSWHIELGGIGRDDAALAVDKLLAAESVPVVRERKGKRVEDDIRPAILRLCVLGTVDQGDGVVLDVDLATQPRGVRPSELLDALAAHAGVRLEERRVCRTHQWIELDGARQEPLLPDATRAPHVLGRAS
jgi:radical SAM-linked protein